MSDQAVLEIKLSYKHLNANLRDEMEKRLKDQYINKLWNNMIIQGLRMTDEVSVLDVNTMIVKVKVNITKYLQYTVGQVVEGIIDLSANPPIIKSEHLKMILNGVSRQSDIAITASGNKLSNNTIIKAKIIQIDIIIGSRFFAGVAELVEAHP